MRGGGGGRPLFTRFTFDALLIWRVKGNFESNENSQWKVGGGEDGEG